jgi:hypothetical protein
MSWNEFRIAAAISRQTLARRCVVLVDRCNWTGHECDVLAVTADLRIIDVEVKISRADFKADAKKDKWWHRRANWAFQESPYREALPGPPAPDIHRDWPPKVWKHYIAMPAEIWSDELLQFAPSPATGILLVREQLGLSTLAIECRRRAMPNKAADKLTPEQVLDIARLANLRMWDAYKMQSAVLSEAA